jgi:hypothetical protein
MQSSIGAGTKPKGRDTETEFRGKEASVGACVTVPLYTHTDITSTHFLGGGVRAEAYTALENTMPFREGEDLI